MRQSLCCLIVFASFAASAADLIKATVTASGSADVLPTEFVVVLTIKQKAPDAKAAHTALKATRDAALGKLPGIDPAKARDEAPTVVEKGAASAIQAAMMGNRGNRAKRRTADDAPEVILQQIVRVPVALAGKDLLAITLEAESMKAAVFAARPLPDQPEEEDPDGTAAYAMAMAGQKQRGPIDFEFAAPKSAELDQKAYAAALKAARAKASNLALASGLKTADIVSVTLQESGKDDSGALGATMNYYRLMMGMMSSGETKPSDNITGPTPALSVNVTLVVECQLK